ncbi:MAG TPA: DUF6565 domain-containing protein [Chitinophagaceae bacterium]|nr:DUF6565 domain-containing protein [Chitinophagaceae bacterium]
MKRIKLVMTAALVITGSIACKNSPTIAQQDAMNLNSYVDSVENLTPVYTAVYWSELDNGYQLRLTKTNVTKATLEAADKTKVEESEAQYAVLKNTYEIKIKEAETSAVITPPDYRQALRNNLFGEGMIGSDMSFSFATANNLLSIYRKFVNTVDENKNNYSREDWDEIKVLYEALDTRKNTVEKQLPDGDNTKIAGLKIKFSAIKATHRGGTKGKENKAAKEKA